MCSQLECGAMAERPVAPTTRPCAAGWVAYLGAANAGIPLSIIVKDYGWGAYFTGGFCSAAGAMLPAAAPGCRH